MNLLPNIVAGLPQGENEIRLDDSYANLRNLVERIIEQVYRIPELLDHSGVPGREAGTLPAFDPKKYEELLATAVLNKVSSLKKKFNLFFAI